MGAISGTADHTASGTIGVAVLGGGVTLAFRDFQTSASGPLQGLLTIRGNLEKRHIDLGDLAGSDTFEVVLPPGTDISLFNTLVIRQGDTTIATATLA